MKRRKKPFVILVAVVAAIAVLNLAQYLILLRRKYLYTERWYSYKEIGGIEMVYDRNIYYASYRSCFGFTGETEYFYDPENPTVCYEREYFHLTAMPASLKDRSEDERAAKRKSSSRDIPYYSISLKSDGQPNNRSNSEITEYVFEIYYVDPDGSLTQIWSGPNRPPEELVTEPVYKGRYLGP